MITIIGRRRCFSLFLSLIFIPGLEAEESSTTSKASAAAATVKNDSNSNVGVRVLFVCIALVAAVGFFVLLYKVWQKKKRAEQHARLLKLFEDDDELEVELGFRD